jgi:hypothetical protein
MNEPSDTSDTSARAQDYVGLRAELAKLTNDFVPVINELWPRLEDHKYRGNCTATDSLRDTTDK